MYSEKLRERKLQDCLILIVDDQEITRLQLETLLADTARCSSVGSGKEALAFCEQHSPDLVLMDVNMPDLDGHQTTALIKAKPACASIPIIFVTSADADEDQSKCWESGCVDFVHKPVNACTLRNRVKSHLTHKLKNDLLEKLIYVDRLTGAYNRHYLDDYLPRLVKDGLRNANPLSLVIFDIDHFKRFNDMYGHFEGDACLWKVSNTINNALMRPMDKLVRLGGEEFLVLLPNTDIEGAVEVTKRLIDGVYELNIRHSASEHQRVTLSAGVAIKSAEDQKTIDFILLEADKNLYEAKMQGRNRLKAPSRTKHQKVVQLTPN
ncbi:diguanylate cyclase [Alteromonas sp. D210916BOD_24]|uniref:GGDEF domain-containing response regulator n=1 Tax=Alteromonas sp. D210916BOD_24 TaxID=3157618 RepID=UPI00399C9795